MTTEPESHPPEQSAGTASPARRAIPWAWIALLTVVLLVIAGWTREPAFRNGLGDLLNRIRDWGPWAAVIVGLAFIPACILLIPGTPLSLFAGFAGGLFVGTVAVSIGSTLGAGAAFLVARYLARERVARWFESNPVFERLDRAIGHSGWKIVILTRLSPLFPFNLLNYAFGLTQVRFRDYLLGSWIGMLPGTILFVYLGSLAQSVAEIVAGRTQQTLLQKILLVVGLLATLVVTAWLGRIAARSLSDKTPPQSP